MTTKRFSEKQAVALGPVALRHGGVDLGFLKRWDIVYPSPSAKESGNEAKEKGPSQFSLIITYRDSSRDTFTGEAAELLLAHLQDHAASSFWRFRPEPPYPTPAERAHHLWMGWQGHGNRPVTDRDLVRLIEHCIHEALQADEQRRMRLEQLPILPDTALQAHALTTALDQAFLQSNHIQRFTQALHQIGKITNQEEIRQLVEAALRSSNT